VTNREIIDGPFDNPGNDELKKINNQECQEPESNDSSFFQEVRLDEAI
jgi:hypothetical protein